jgi:hypothetical protein
VKNLTHVEVLDAFQMADLEHKGYLPMNVWLAFHKFFIIHFQDCVKASKVTGYLLDGNGIFCLLDHH